MEYWSDRWTLNRKRMPRVLRCERVGVDGARHALHTADVDLCTACASYAVDSLVDRVNSTPHEVGRQTGAGAEVVWQIPAALARIRARTSA